MIEKYYGLCCECIFYKSYHHSFVSLLAAAVVVDVDLPVPAKGLSLSSHKLTPSQAQILLEFSNRPADRAMIPQDNNCPQFPFIWKTIMETGFVV